MWKHEQVSTAINKMLNINIESRGTGSPAVCRRKASNTAYTLYAESFMDHYHSLTSEHNTWKRIGNLMERIFIYNT